MILLSKTFMPVLFAVLSLSGCTSWSTVSVKPETTNGTTLWYQISPPLYQGDKIQYTLNSGQRGEMTVAKVTPHAIYDSQGGAVPTASIATLERKTLSPAKTTAATVGGVAGAAAVAMVIFTVVVAGGIGATLSG